MVWPTLGSRKAKEQEQEPIHQKPETEIWNKLVKKDSTVKTLNVGLLNSIYRHIWWSNRENRLIIDDRRNNRQATTEHCRSPFEQLSAKRDSTDWTLNGRVAAVTARSVGKRLQACSAAPHTATEADRYNVNSVQWGAEGDDDSTSSRSLPSQPCCAHIWHADARAAATETFYHTRCTGEPRRPCQHRTRAPFTAAPAVCQHAWTSQDSTGSCDITVDGPSC